MPSFQEKIWARVSVRPLSRLSWCNSRTALLPLATYFTSGSASHWSWYGEFGLCVSNQRNEYTACSCCNPHENRRDSGVYSGNCQSEGNASLKSRLHRSRGATRPKAENPRSSPIRTEAAQYGSRAEKSFFKHKARPSKRRQNIGIWRISDGGGVHMSKSPTIVTSRAANSCSRNRTNSTASHQPLLNIAPSPG